MPCRHLTPAGGRRAGQVGAPQRPASGNAEDKSAFLLPHQIGTVPFKEGLEGSSQLQRTGGEKGTGVLTAAATLMGQGGSNISLQQGLQSFNEDDLE